MCVLWRWPIRQGSYNRRRIHLCGLCAWLWAGGGRHERERDRQAGQVGFLGAATSLSELK
jgi:hypothetical protein